jgi:hypothetical protein
MKPARIYPWRRMRRFRAPSSGLDKFFAAQFSAGYITSMSGFDLRQAQVELQLSVGFYIMTSKFLETFRIDMQPVEQVI